MELPITDPRDDELRRLAAASGRGDSAAFHALVARVIAPIRRWATVLTGDADDADDVAQLVLLRLHQRVDQFEERSRFTSWLYRITRNVAHDRRMTEARRRALLADHVARNAPPTTTNESASSLDAATLAALVRSCTERLTPREREVFELVDLNGISAGEVAAQLGLAASTVRVLLGRARRTLRLAMLAEHPDLLEEYRDEL